jgi:N-acetylmuramoyl-L-alanine amidase
MALIALPHRLAAQELPADTPQSVPGATRTIAIDPGHGGPESGAVAGDLVERDLNLSIALVLAQLLRDKGFVVVLTRSTAAAVNPYYVQVPDRAEARRDLETRVDIANLANADLFLSIHNNGSPVPAERGTEVWYDSSRPFSDRNQTLAQLVLDNVVSSVRAAGFDDISRGVRDDREYRVVRGRSFPLYVLGPGASGVRPHAATAMPGVLGENLFLTNVGDAAALHDPKILRAIASGYADAVDAYFSQFPDVPGTNTGA